MFTVQLCILRACVLSTDNIPSLKVHDQFERSVEERERAGRLTVMLRSVLHLWATDKGFIAVGGNEPLAPAHTHIAMIAYKQTHTITQIEGFYPVWTSETPHNLPVLLHLQKNQYMPSQYLLYHFTLPFSLLFGGLGALYHHQRCVLNSRADLAVSRQR